MEFDKDPEAKIAVFCGNHGTFCAGFDLKELATMDFSTTEKQSENLPFQEHFSMFETAPMGPSRMLLSKPVIAAVSGYAVAGGLELSLCKAK